MVADQPEESEHAIFTVGGRLVSGSSMKATDRANGDRRERVSGDRGRRNGDGARATSRVVTSTLNPARRKENIESKNPAVSTADRVAVGV
jgi:hypothetical protein